MLSFFLAAALAAATQAARIAGVVTDSVTGAPAAGVHVEARALGLRVAATVTDARGSFRLGSLAPGRYSLSLIRVGYRPLTLDEVAAGTTDLVVAMSPVPVPVAPVVVTAQRAEQATLEAPASVSVISRQRIEETTALTPLDHVRTTAGVDYASKGLTSATFGARGSRSVLSTVLLVLTDYRQAAVPSLRLNVPYLIPSSSDDIERIEVLRGASAALYGPDSDRGVLHVITRSPFESRGASLTVMGGERELLGVAARYAGVAGPRLAGKLSFEWLRGREWPSADSSDVAPRDPYTERVAAEGRVDWRPGPATELIAQAGVAEAVRNVELTNPGPFQARHWRYTYLQTRVRHRELFANAVLDLSDAGETFNLRTGEPVVDQSRLVAGQVQHRAAVGPTRLIYGVDTRWTVPRTGGTINGRFENDDLVRETGVYASSTTPLGPRLDLVGALRADHHNVIGDLALSPRLGLVYAPRPEHAFRVTYNRAYSTPTTTTLFIDILALNDIGGLPFDVRGIGTPRGGYTFRTDCNGPCMRSPFAADTAQYLPADATLLWPAVVAFAQRFGVDLSGIPAPTAADVASDLRLLNVETAGFDPVSAADVKPFAPNTREITDAFEVGWKGLVGGRLFLGLDVYHYRVSDVMGSIQPGTPNVFFNRADIQQYLARYMRQDSAQLIGDAISQAPVGTISPQESPYATAILLVTPQGGGFGFWGADLDLVARLSERLSVSASYSWVSRDSVAGTGPLRDYALGAPRHKGALAVEWRDERRGLTASLRGRALTAYPVVSGVWRGTVDAYTVVDAAAGWRLPLGREVRVSVSAFNLLDNRHREYVGAPRIGRLVVARLQTRI